MKKAVILFSGGLDSTTCLAIAKAEGFDCYLLSIRYGQKHSVEIEVAEKIAKAWQATEHQTIDLPLNYIAQSSLTRDELAVPDYIDSQDIPNTYVPGRNTIFLSLALSFAESIGAYDIFAGVNAVDYSHYPDCRPEYIKAFETLASLATKAGSQGERFRIRTPLIDLSKADIIKKGVALGVDYSQTVSCYRANDKGLACGKCDSCVFRKKGFKEAGVADPTRYV
jgi:7-cyano-7-deazaguanine synthase